MTALIQMADRVTTRELILSLNNGILSEEDIHAMDSCVSMASHLWIGYINDRPVCAWGLVPPTLLADSAYLWLYSTAEVEAHKFLFVRKSQVVIGEMLKIYPVIWGITRVEAERSIRWLRWLGAKFGTPNAHFIPFHIEAPHG